MVRLQVVPLPLQKSPPQPRKLEPPLGVSVIMSVAPAG